MKRTLRVLMLAAAAALAASSAARAEFDIVISASTLGGLGGSLDINVSDATLNSSTDPNVIAANLTNLNATLAGVNAGFKFTGLSAVTTPVVPGVESQLNILGTIVTTTGGAGVAVTITASAVDYTFPLGAASMTSTASDSISGGFGGRTFQSFFDPTNTEFGTTIGSSKLTFPPGAGSFSDSGTSPLTSVGVIAGNYSLTNITTVNLGAVGASDLFTGVTTVRSVPEPGSLALLALGGTALVVGLRRRKLKV